VLPERAFLDGGHDRLIPILGWLVWAFVVFGVFVLWIAGPLSAVTGDMRPAPILGEHYQRWFAGVFA
jgi:uncharacterized membrane protein